MDHAQADEGPSVVMRSNLARVEGAIVTGMTHRRDARCLVVLARCIKLYNTYPDLATISICVTHVPSRSLFEKSVLLSFDDAGACWAEGLA
jgi:hypothetical protein